MTEQVRTKPHVTWRRTIGRSAKERTGDEGTDHLLRQVIWHKVITSVAKLMDHREKNQENVEKEQCGCSFHLDSPGSGYVIVS